MKVLVKKVDIKRGTNQKGEAYCFANVLVVFDEKTADFVTVDSNVCNPDLIKAGMKAEMMCPIGNMKRAIIFEPIGANKAQTVDNAGGYSVVSPEDYNIDSLTGEVTEKNKK